MYRINKTHANIPSDPREKLRKFIEDLKYNKSDEDEELEDEDDEFDDDDEDTVFQRVLERKNLVSGKKTIPKCKQCGETNCRIPDSEIYMGKFFGVKTSEIDNIRYEIDFNKLRIKKFSGDIVTHEYVSGEKLNYFSLPEVEKIKPDTVKVLKRVFNDLFEMNLKSPSALNKHGIYVK